MLPLPGISGCPALVAPGPSGSTKKPAHALAAEASNLERTLSDLVNQAYGLTPAESALMWQTTPPRKPISPPFPSQGTPECSQSAVRRSALGNHSE